MGDHKPCQRFMSAYEQRKEATDRKFQYVLFHARPYEIIAFKVPSYEMDQKKPQLNDKTSQNTRLNSTLRRELFFTYWDSVNKIYTLQNYRLFLKSQEHRKISMKINN